MRPTGRAPRPDPNPMRLLLAMGGVASASALLTALLPSVAPVAADTSGLGSTDGTTVAAQPDPSVVHVKQYVVLAPGQTAPPKSQVLVKPTPTPRVRVVTTTRQSGTP